MGAVGSEVVIYGRGSQMSVCKQLGGEVVEMGNYPGCS